MSPPARPDPLELCVLGLNHRTTPVELRERLSVELRDPSLELVESPYLRCRERPVEEG